MKIIAKYTCTLLLILLSIPGAADENPIRIKAVGDIMLGSYHPDGFLRPEEKGSILKYIRPLIQDADITLGLNSTRKCNSKDIAKGISCHSLSSRPQNHMRSTNAKLQAAYPGAKIRNKSDEPSRT